ncbi:MAG: ATP-binding domain-containing protein, partial [Planctomycetota bacterium]|nr:ATP-binding domain-containing protein [Planctomycetota bacterium]
PYEIVRGTSFYERKEVRDILAYLEILHNPNDEVNLRRIINTPARGLGDKTVDVLLAFARKEGIALFHALPHVDQMPELAGRARAAVTHFKDLTDRLLEEPRESMKDLIDAVIHESGYAASLSEEDDKERLENLGELITLGANFDRDAAAAGPEDDTVPRGLEGFLQTVALASDQDGYDERADRVPLMTLHAAKGLEFPAVFVAGCEDGLLPHVRSREDRSQVEEERRLFFVGLTRAKQFLTLTYGRFRRVRGRPERHVPSPFLREIPRESVEPIDETTGTTPATLGEGYGYSGPGRDRVIKPETDKVTGLTLGEMVRHPTYGIGRVMAFTTGGGRRLVRIRFNTVGEKLLDPQYAKLGRA